MGMRGLGVLLLAVTPRPAAATAPVVAVFDIEDRTDQPDLSTLSITLTEYLEGKLAEGGRFRVVPRSEIREALRDAKRESYRNCVDEACQIEIGQALAAEKSLRTQILQVGSRCIFKTMLFDLKLEVSERVATVKSGCAPEDLLSAVDEMVAKLEHPNATKTRTEPNVVPAEPEPALPPQIPGLIELEGAKSVVCAPDPFCLSLGRSHRDGTDGRRQNAKRAARYFQQACQRGIADGCTDLGRLYEQGKGLPKELDRAMQLYRWACKQGSGAGCSALGFMYKQGRGLRKDHYEAVQWYRRGCDGHDHRGCTNLGYMHEKGWGTPKNVKKAVELYDRGCQLGSAIGCTNLGYMREKGRGTARDIARARLAYDLGCQRGDKRACTNRSRLD